MLFKDLTEGDRFTAHGSLWTKISVTTARKHSEPSISLGKRGYGYIGDPMCSFELTNRVKFVPVEITPSSTQV